MPERKRLTRIQELVYEIRVSEVMTQDVVTVTPETSMGELRELLRTHRISGAPVLADGRLVGIISIEDFINWLAEGAQSARVADRMTREVLTVRSDEPLVHLVNRLDRYGFGRLPVVDRETGALEGVVTKGDIVEGLLHKLEIGVHEEELHRYRASHIFEDIIADRTTLMFQYRVPGKDLKKAGSGAASPSSPTRRR